MIDTVKLSWTAEQNLMFLSKDGLNAWNVPGSPVLGSLMIFSGLRCHQGMGAAYGHC